MQENKKIFITDYLLSLIERSSKTKDGDYKIGFDWVISQLGLVKDWQPIRLPFKRDSGTEITTYKAGAEFGIDLSFYNKENQELIIFVLKDEALTYANWIANNFVGDLDRAKYPDLENIEIEKSKINTVKIILAYNKGDDKNGIDSYNAMVKSAPSKIYDTINLKFERWNIDRLTTEVTGNLLTPDLLPQNLSSLLSYICSQVSDFDYGSEEWENQLIPNFRNFLNTTLSGKIDDKKINLIPLTLLIIFQYKKDTANSVIGWIDIIEWAMLALWNIYPNCNEELKVDIIKIWFDFYIRELKEYFSEQKHILCSDYSIRINSPHLSLMTINSINSAYWHIGRLGILALSSLETYLTSPEKNLTAFESWITEYSNYFQDFIKANKVTLYPLIDLHHIELFLILITLLFADNRNAISKILLELQTFLQIRRFKNSEVPFIESYNRLELVAEYVAIRERPIEWVEKSSYLLMMIMEFSFILDEKERNALINAYFDNIIKGDEEENIDEIGLISWRPEKDWEDKIYKQTVTEGVGIATLNFPDFLHKNEEHISIRIKSFIDESRTLDFFPVKRGRAFNSYILACIKNKSPLPPEFWRQFIFDNDKTNMQKSLD